MAMLLLSVCDAIRKDEAYASTSTARIMPIPSMPELATGFSCKVLQRLS